MDTATALSAWQQNGRLEEIAPTPGGPRHYIFVNEYGEGPPVLFLHGFPTASFDYAHLVPRLPGKRLIFFDFLGFGFSDKPRPHAYSLFEQAAIAEAVLGRRGLSEAAVVAHDMGTSVALLLLQRRRVRVSKLVLLNGSLLLQYYQPLISQRLLLHPVVGPLLTALRLSGRPAFARQFSSLFPKPPPRDEIDAFWALIAHNDGPRIYHLLIRYLNERKEHELAWLDALARHDAPLLILWGQQDPVSRPRIAEAVHERRPDARYVPLPALGHYPQWEDPVTVGAEIAQFLDG